MLDTTAQLGIIWLGGGGGTIYLTCTNLSRAKETKLIIQDDCYGQILGGGGGGGGVKPFPSLVEPSSQTETLLSVGPSS